MKETFKVMGFAILFWMVVFATVAFSQSGQNTSRWDLYSGKWDLFSCYNDSTTQDSLWFEQGDTLYTEAFKLWPYMSVHAVIVDTASATDSVKILVKFLQSGETWTNQVKEEFAQVRDVTWRSTASLSEADTLTDVGHYLGNLTDEPIYMSRWGRFMLISNADSKKLTGNYIFLRVNGWNDK